MSRFWSFIPVIAIVASLATELSSRELQLGSVAPEQSPWGKTFDAFAAMVTEKSGGELAVTHFPAGQLGQEQDMVRQMARGRVDMVAVSNTAMSLLVPEIGLLSAPYLFANNKQSDCTYAHMSDTFRAPLEDAGAVALSWFEVGHMIVITKDQLIKSPGELAGMKIRSAPTASDTRYLEEAGASPVPLNVAETLQSLQTGSISGATFPVVFAIASGMAQIAPNVTVTKHTHQVGGVLISSQVWRSLGDEERSLLKSSAEAVFAGLRSGIRDAEIGLLKKAEAEGASVHYPTELELDAWRKAALSAYPKIVEDYGEDAPEVWADIQAALAQCPE